MPIPLLAGAAIAFTLLEVGLSIKDLIEGDDGMTERLQDIEANTIALGVGQEASETREVAILTDVHYADTDWLPSLLTQIQAVRTNVDTNLPAPTPPAPPTATAIKNAVWDEPITALVNASNQAVSTVPARGALSVGYMVLGDMYNRAGVRPRLAPDFYVSHPQGASLPSQLNQLNGLNVRGRPAGQTVGEYLNANTTLTWTLLGGLWTTDIAASNGSGFVIKCLVADSSETLDPRIDTLLARTEDTAAADDKILAADFTAGSYQDELDALLARTVQTAEADQKIMDLQFGEEYAGLVSSESFAIEGAGVVTFPAGSAGCTVDFAELPPNVAAFGTAEPVRYRWLGEVAAGLGSRLYKTHFLDYSLNIITDWPADVDRIRYQLANGAAATLTILRPPS